MSDTPKICPLFVIAMASGIHDTGDARTCLEDGCAFWIHEVRIISDTKSTDYSECSIPYMAKAVERLSQQ